jgi:hypothetical protein
VTVGALALFPAASAFQYLHFQSTLDQSRFITQFDGVRSGVFNSIRFDDLEGLVSMPSFHVAGALIVVWSLRRHGRLFWPAVSLNVLLAAATVLTGAHYAVDLFGTAAMFAASIWLWNAVARKWIARPSAAVAPAATSVAGLDRFSARSQ